MKFILWFILLISFTLGVNAQKKKTSEYLREAREPGDSNFVIFKNGQRKAIKSIKETDVTKKVKIVFTDGSTGKYDEEDIKCYQDESAFAKCFKVVAPGYEGWDLGVRTERGAINLYYVRYVIVGQNGHGVQRFSTLMIETGPDVINELEADTLQLPFLRRYLKHNEATMARLNGLGKIWKQHPSRPDKYMEEVIEYIRFYNKEAIESKL